MACIRWCIVPLLFATIVLADYFIDNADPSVVYSMPASQSGQAWEIFSVSTQSLVLNFSNSTGNYTITLDASHCYDQNYSLGVCDGGQSCFVEIPFTGSGITMYVFSAGFSGMTASFSIDGGTAVSNTIPAPPPPTFQVPNVSLYSVYGLPTGNHTIKMVLLDWEGAATSMKFDYARVNDTFVASSTTTSSISPTSVSQTPTQTSTGNSAGAHKANVGGIIGASLGSLALVVTLVIGFLYLRKPKAKTHQNALSTPESTFQMNPFPSEFGSSAPPSVPYGHLHQLSSSSQLEATLPVLPLTRSAILRDALAAGNQSLQSIKSGQGSAVVLAQRRQPLQSADVDMNVHARARSSASQVADTAAGSHASDSQHGSRYNLTAGQVEIIDRLWTGNVPPDTISRVVEGFALSSVARSETNDKSLVRAGSVASVAPPPSYQSQDG